MFRVIWQHLRNNYMKRRLGLDNADIQHIRADLRFRLALVEYAYFGRSGKKVARALAELRSLLGDKAMHRYMRSLDPDLRTQFVERFQSQRREAESRDARNEAESRSLENRLVGSVQKQPTVARESAAPPQRPASNVVDFDTAARRVAQFESAEQERDDTQPAESRE